jgi:ABC-2 type transport system permease protein
MYSLTKLTWMEFKLIFREPVAVFFTLAFPLLLMIIFGTIFGNEPESFLGGFGQIDLSVAGYIAMIIGTIGMLGLPVTLSNYREQGILRRLRATPLQSSSILWSQVIVQTFVAILGILILFIAGKLLFDLRLPTGNLMIVPAIILCALSFFAIGFALAGVLSGPRTAQAVGMALFYPMLFLSGAAVPRFVMPEKVQQIAEFLPLTQVVILLEDLWLKGSWNIPALLVVTAILILGLLISRLTFRWE